MIENNIKVKLNKRYYLLYDTNAYRGKIITLEVVKKNDSVSGVSKSSGICKSTNKPFIIYSVGLESISGETFFTILDAKPFIDKRVNRKEGYSPSSRMRLFAFKQDAKNYLKKHQ